LEKGLAELLAYFSLADREQKHIFNPHSLEWILFDPQRQKYIRVPQIIFTR
jgi:hypothetical protein